MKQFSKCRFLSLLLALALCFSAVAPTVVFAEDIPAHDAFPVTGNSLYSDSLYAAGWVDCDLPESQMRPLLNRQTLYPQKTGWQELDQLIEGIIAEAGTDADTYTKLRYAYDYLVKEVTYSWEGYSNTNASTASYNSVTKYNYLTQMTYEDGLQKSIPDDMANRAYHILKYKKGVCYDYAIAIAVIARYIGIESYVHTGLYYFEPYYGSNYSGHHGWALLVLSGEKYVFDPQRDARNWEYNNKANGYYFGIDYATATNLSNRPSYYPNYYASDQTANAERDASMLPVTAARAHKVTISLQSTTGGTVSGGGDYITGTTATLTATANSGYRFIGWYDTQDNLVSNAESFTFTVTDGLTLQAKFKKIVNITVSASRSGTATGSDTYLAGDQVTLSAAGDTANFQGWYTDDGTLVSTEANYSFTAASNTTLIAMFEGDIFYDLPSEGYYVAFALEAQKRGIITGMTNISFAPDTDYTRAMMVKILANMEGVDTSYYADSPSPFEDVPPTAWYYEIVNWAYATGIVNGVDATHFAPTDPITREQMLTMVDRYLAYKNIAPEEQELSYSDADQISDYALSSVKKAQTLNLIEGYDDGTFRPQSTLPRREGVTIMMRLVHYLDGLSSDGYEDSGNTGVE